MRREPNEVGAVAAVDDPAAKRPTGTVTFLFTDVEGSTKRWEADAAAMAAMMAEHDRLLSEVIAATHGYVFKMVGDACCAAFDQPADALEAALVAQNNVRSAAWNTGSTIAVRMAIHTGVAQERNGDYFGPPLNRVARLLSTGHGGQILVSLASQQLLRDSMPNGVRMVSLGEHRLKDLSNPETIYQVAAPPLPQDFPPLKSLDEKRTNLPVQLTSFVGRARELTEVVTMLREAEVRLLTLTGPGGTGKTRLGLQAGAEMLDEFADGVFVTMLAPVHQPAQVMTSVRLTLGAAESGNDETASIIERVGDKSLLLILDNFEHLVSAAHHIPELLTQCPNLCILVTSRLTLHCAGEHVHPIPPMAAPEATEDLNAETARASEAVRLFAARARAATTDFQLDDTNASAVAGICARLDGLPLAIELAAARVRMLAPSAILRRLNSTGGSMNLLTGGSAGGPSPYRTLLSAIEWSHSLLDSGAQLLLARLSVFRGGFSIEAAEAVCGDQECDAFTEMETLIDASLVSANRDGDVTRFQLLETIREYAEARLEPEALTAMRHRHARYFFDAASTICPLGASLAGAEAVAMTKLDAGNLELAVDSLLGLGDLDSAAFLCSFMVPYWVSRGQRAFGLQYLGRIKSHPAFATISNPRQVDFHYGLAVLSFSHADYEDAETHLRAAIEILEVTPNAAQLSECLRYLGNTLWMREDLGRAEPLFRRSLEIAREAGDPRLETEALTQLGLVAAESGDLDTAVETWRDLANAFQLQPDARGQAKTLVNIGVALSYLGRDAEAVTALIQAAGIFREISDDLGLAHALMCLADSRRALGALPAARADLAEAAPILMAADDRYRLSLLFRLAGSLFSDRGLHDPAATMWGAEEAMRGRIELHADEADDTAVGRMNQSRAALGDDEWRTAWNAGTEMDTEAACTFVLHYLTQQTFDYLPGHPLKTAP